MEFPPNSKTKGPTVPPEDKDVKRVTSTDPKRRKKSLGKQFRETFVSGDARTAAQYVFFGVLLPAAKDSLLDGIHQYFERLMFGEARSRRPSSGMSASPYGHVKYNQKFPGSQQSALPQRTLSQRARSRHDFDEILLTNRSEAEDVIERMFEIVSRHGSASVADLYELTGIASAHTDHKWGWTDMRGSGVTRYRNQGYLLNLPDPEPLG